MDYRQRLRNIREDRDFTQEEIGSILNKSQQGYNHIETGRSELKIEDLVKWSKHYDLSADYVIGLIDKADEMAQLQVPPRPPKRKTCFCMSFLICRT